MKVTVEGQEGEFKHLDSTPPPGAKERSVMTLEATVENKPQKLRTIRPLVYAVKDIPAILPGEAQLVLRHMLAIFVEKQTVKEGSLGDLIFGCQYGRYALPEALVVVGVRQLVNFGYLAVKAPNNDPLSLTADSFLEAWLNYTDEMLDLIYGRFEA